MKTLLTYLLPLIAFSLTAQVQNFVYENDFSDKLINEKEMNRSGNSIKIKNGYLYSEQTQDFSYWCIAERLFIDLEKDFEIEMKMKPYGHSPYTAEFGLLFGLRNVSMFNSFTISGSGLARVSSKVMDLDLPFLNPTLVAGYTPGDWVVLKVSHKAGKYYFYVNNTLVYEKKKIDMHGRWFGWYTNSKMGLQLDYFHVKQYRGTINVIPNAGDFVKERVKGAVNTDKDEVCPVLSQDGKQLYFGRFVNPSNDFFYVSKEGSLEFISTLIDTSGQTNGSIKTRVKLSQPWYISSVPDAKGFYAGEKDNFLSPSGLSIAYFNSTTGNNEASKNISFAPGNNVTIKHASMSKDESVMIISGYEHYEPSGLELYVSKKTGGVWSVPKKIASLNTKGDEITPFISNDMKQLYFSSDGHPGYGFTDVFVANRLDDSWTNWSSPQNMGPGVNDNAFNEYFMMPDTTVSKYAFMSSSYAHINNLDLFRVKMKVIPPPEVKIVLKGTIVYAPEDPKTIKAVELQLKDKDKTKEKLAVDKANKFTYEMKADDPFTLRLLDTNYIITEQKDLTAIGKTKERIVELKVTRIIRGESFVLENIYFSPNKFDLLPASYTSLDALVTAMKHNTRLKIEVQGHTSKTSEGSAFDVELSTNRAAAVKEYIISKGISSSRIISKGYGYTRPMYTDSAEDHQAKNRRVEIKILEK